MSFTTACLTICKARCHATLKYALNQRLGRKSMHMNMSTLNLLTQCFHDVITSYSNDIRYTTRNNVFIIV